MVLKRWFYSGTCTVDSSVQDLYIQWLWQQERSKWLSSATLVTMYLLGLLFTNWKKLLVLVYLVICILAIYYTTDQIICLASHSASAKWQWPLLLPSQRKLLSIEDTGDPRLVRFWLVRFCGLVQFTNFWPVTYLYGSTYNLVVLAVTPFLLSLWLY